jgi:dTDP-4-amino-4,6-dideoxygalactose transaminase
MAWAVPLFDLEYDEREEAAVLGVLRSKWLTMGEKTAEFERSFADALGGGRVLATANCTAALHLAVRASGIGPGDEVILPALTFVATANAVLYERATPVFADIVGGHDLTIDPKDVAAKITRRTKAIIVMHYGGYPCRMGEILAIAQENGLTVIEDCAHAPGARYEGRPLGTLGDFGCYSFFTNKNLSTGEGGAIWCHDEAAAERVRLMRSHGMTAQTLDRHKGHAWGYDVVELGYNYRLTEIEAALALVQLGKLPANNAARRRHVERYRQLLARVPGLLLPFADFESGWGSADVSAYHLMVVLLPSGVQREPVQAALKEAGIQTSVHYRPLHTFSASGLASAPAIALDRTDSVAPRILTLPLWPGMADTAVDAVTVALASALRSDSLSAALS